MEVDAQAVIEKLAQRITALVVESAAKDVQIGMLTVALAEAEIGEKKPKESK